LSAVQIPRKVHAVVLSKQSAVYHVESQVWQMKRLS